MSYAVAACIGLVSGVVSGVFGVGGGVLMVPAMMYFLGMNIKEAIGTSLAVIVPTALAGALKHHHLDQLRWGIAFTLMPTAILGGLLGARLTTLVTAGQLKTFFGGFLVLIGLRLMLWR